MSFYFWPQWQICGWGVLCGEQQKRAALKTNLFENFRDCRSHWEVRGHALGERPTYWLGFLPRLGTEELISQMERRRRKLIDKLFPFPCRPLPQKDHTEVQVRLQSSSGQARRHWASPPAGSRALMDSWEPDSLASPPWASFLLPGMLVPNKLIAHKTSAWGFAQYWNQIQNKWTETRIFLRHRQWLIRKHHGKSTLCILLGCVFIIC